MNPRPRLLGAALAAMTSVVLVAGPGQQVFRGGTDLVQLNVTVANGARHFIGGLSRDDFQIFEDGVPQDISVFSAERQPIALSILLDSSTSMDTKIAVAQEAAVGFVKRLSEKDVAEVIEFNSHERLVQAFTGDKTALEAAIHETVAGGSTALYNAMYVALRDLAHTRAQQANDLWRQAIVVLSDGEDTTSLKTYDDVLDETKRADAVIYAIGLRSKEDASPRHGFSEGDFVMRSFAQETGGWAFFVEDLTQLSSVYVKIADELANQYVIGYTSKNHKHDGTWRKIAVRVSKPDMNARTRTGYFAPAVDR
jgi:Ca-activated chloride channel family protein